MDVSIASLKRENSNVKDQLSVMADEIPKMKEMLLEQSKKLAAMKDEKVQEFISKEYLCEWFRFSAGKDLQRLSVKLDKLAVELKSFQEYRWISRV